MKKQRKLFCEICPLTYRISIEKGKLLRNIKDAIHRPTFALTKQDALLPVLIYSHQSLIRRQLDGVNPILQENKAINLSLAAPKISHVLIKPGETFSFWKLVGSCSKRKGYLEGLVIDKGTIDKGIGGGMCQFSNLIHWLVLHTPLTIVEHHHHDGLDLFPDAGRKVPFGSGTSIFYNYVDYRFYNGTDNIFQLVVSTNHTHLCGELRAAKPFPYRYEVLSEDECFTKENGIVYRNNKIYRRCIEKKSGKILHSELLKTNHAKVLYDTSQLSIIEK